MKGDCVYVVGILEDVSTIGWCLEMRDVLSLVSGLCEDCVMR